MLMHPVRSQHSRNPFHTVLAALFLVLGGGISSARAAPPAASPAESAPPAAAVSPIRSIDGGTVNFTGYNKPVKTELRDLLYVGMLKPEEGEPYFLFSGRNCKGCSSFAFLHVLRPSGAKVDSFVYPGKIFLPKNRELVLDSRAFFGRCVVGLGDAYVVYQREKVGKKHPKLVTSVYVAEAGPRLLREKLFEKGGPKLQATLKLVKARSCHEVDGKNRVADVQPLDGKVKGADPSEEDEDEVEAAATPAAGG